ncbi:MAG: zf-HC2 domain-containing protein [Oscillospiraceae bacterium]|nr:zf-HC2 domain-containing protein [Oscillospiraceae bacterium]
MNNCELYQELISRLVDGELSRNEYAALEAHMENCAECSAMYAVFASLSDIIGGEDEPLPEDLHENIMAGVRRSAMINHNRRRLSKPVRNVLATAACAALVLFAARGLAPEKAADTMLSQSQTAAMDVQRMEAAPAAPAEAPEAAAVQTVAPSAAPVEVVTPTATPVVNTPAPKDIYLEDENNEAKPATGNTNNYVNYVSPTPRPTPIVVDTPVMVATPRPTPTPNIVTITASPAPTAAVPQTQTPAAVAEPPVQESSLPEAELHMPAPASIEPAAESAIPAPAAETKPEMAAAPAAEPETAAAPAAVSEPAATEPAATEAPSFKDRLKSFFSMRPAAMSVEEPAEAAAEEETEAPTEESLPENEAEQLPQNAEELMPVPADQAGVEEKEKKPFVIKLENAEKLTVLENLLDGEEAKLPETEADYMFSFALAEPEEGLEDYEIKVLIYEKTLYYVQIFSKDDFCICVSPCKLEDFVKYVNGLSDKEKGIDPAVSPAVIWPAAPVTESPEVSPEASEVPALPAQSPENSEAAAEQ